MKKTFLLALLLFISTSNAATIIVDANGSGDYTTIQAAIDSAINGDSIIVADGTYTGAGNRDIDFKGKAITIQSENGPENCIIDCQANAHRGFYFHTGEGSNSILDGLTIINGDSNSAGGGIFCQSSSPTIRKCIISGNLCQPYEGICYGGGIYCASSNPRIEQCIIKENSSIGRGGGIYLNASNPNIINCLIINNVASTSEYGGGIGCKNSPSINIVNCTFKGNSAGRGGAIDLISSTAVITNSILWNNSPSEIGYTATGHATVTYSNIKEGWSGTGNINTDPLFVSTADYHLAFGSPCIDKGTNNPPGGPTTIDLDGSTRPFDGDYDSNAITDMGAYEFHQNPGSPVLAVNPHNFKFSCPAGGPNPDSKILRIWNAGGGELNWNITKDANWLNATPVSGKCSTETNEVILSVDANNLVSNMYSCTLVISDPCDSNNTQFIPVNFRVGPIIYVPADHNNIQAAIDAAFDGDQIVVADGVYTGQGNHDIDFNGKALTLKSQSGPVNCIIDCQGSSQDSRRGFYFHSGETERSILDGFTITNAYLYEGALPEGGGILCLSTGTNPTIRNCIIIENWAYSGGGISCYAASPAIFNCTIVNNHAYYDKGGGILCWNYSNAKIIGCTISNNEAKFSGGGIYFYGGSPILTNSLIWDNSPSEIARTTNPVCNLFASYCDIQGGWSGTAIIDSDPCFSNPSSKNYHLRNNSPCINIGDPYYSPAPQETDIDGEDRIMGGRVDIGSDEISDMVSDFDKNDEVDTYDLSNFAMTWLNDPCESECISCDLDEDHLTTMIDFALFARNWGHKVDTESPTSPGNLTITGTTISTVSLNWDTSTDNINVVGYKIYRDNNIVGWTGGTCFIDTELESNTIYTYAVSAYDANYNDSNLSNSCQATTMK
ncbi:MAG: right-handed parallel beta-helix repeat-containing protein [Sedimentisphaerales bacterium]